MTTKKCSTCDVVKPISEFNKDKKNRDGFSGKCRACCAEYSRIYRAENAERITEQKRLKRLENLEAERERGRIRRLENLEREKARCAAWYKENKQRHMDGVKDWVARNPERRRKISNAHKERKRSTPQGRLESNISRGVHRGLKPGAKANTPTFKILPYTPDELRAHLESLFLPGMTWENYGRSGWHVDHIRPLASFNYETPDDPEFKEAWALSNLQPLWWLDNISKGSKWDGPTPANDNSPSAKKDDKAA